MKFSWKRSVLSIALVMVLLASLVYWPQKADAAYSFYGDYTDVAKIKNYSSSCPGMQGLAVGSQYLYTIKINSDDTLAVISKTDKDTGTTTTLKNNEDGTYYFKGLGHANDMDVWGIDGSSHLFVTSTNEGYGGIVRYRVDGSSLTKVASYRLTYNGAEHCATALAIESVSNGVITFITKLGQNIYTGTVSTSATSATIPVKKICTIDKSRAYIREEYLDLSDWVNQGYGYYKGNLFVPLSGPDDQLNRSVILVYDIEDAIKNGNGGIVYPSEELSFRVTSGAYSALFEIESCDICPSDGKLYFNTNRRVTDNDTNHDGVSSFDGYTFTGKVSSGDGEMQTYTIRYDANGGTGTMADTTITYGISSKIRTNTFTRNGFKFAGWTAYRTTQKQWYYTDGTNSGWYAEGSQPSGYTKSVYSDGTSVAKTTAVDKDVVIFYAQWTPLAQTYTIKYFPNGGTGTMEDTLVPYGYSTNVRKNTFTRTGYKFVGWTAYRTSQGQWYYTNGTTSAWYAEGSQPAGYVKDIYVDEVSVAKTTAVSNDVVYFYAQWEQSCTHSYTSKVTTAAGCNSTGVRTYTCTGCGDSYTETIAATGHSYTAKVTAPTCTADGYTTYTCSGCGDSYKSNTVAASGHSYTGVITYPTCNANGYTTYTCSGCGDTYTGNVVASSGHSYVSKVTAPTCNSNGHTTYTCSKCGNSYIGDIVYTTGHSFANGSCTACGAADPDYVPDYYLFGYINDANYGCEDDYQNLGVYKFVDGKLVVQFNSTSYVGVKAADNQNWYMTNGWQGNATSVTLYNTKEAISADKFMIPGGVKLELTLINNGDDTFILSYEILECPHTSHSTNGACTLCGQIVSHSYQSVKTPATCTSAGFTTYTCSVCGNSYVSNPVSAKGHSYSNGSCVTCGDKDPNYSETKDPKLTLDYPTLSFEDEILYNVYYTVDDPSQVSEMGLATFSTRNESGTLATANEIIPGSVGSGSSYMVRSNGIPAKNLSDALYFKVYAKLNNGTVVYSDIAGYHAVLYANTVLNSNAALKAKALVVAMLNYGAAAQEYFGYKTNALMNAGLTDEQLDLVSAYDESMVEDVAKADSNKVGSFIMNGGYSNIFPTVSFEGAFSINYYFTPNKVLDAAPVMYYWDAETYNSVSKLTPENATGAISMKQDGSNWGATIEGIAAKAIDETIYVAGFYTSGGVSYPTSVISYSLGRYCETIAAQDNAFGAATAVYGFYAKAYFA